MKRYAMQQLVDWKNKPNRKPLILKGARQVGKTWLMKEFGRQHFSKVAYVTFYNNQRMKRVFDDDYDIDRIIMNINIEAKEIIKYKDELSGYKITPKGMLQIYLRQDIPTDVLKKLFTETLIKE